MGSRLELHDKLEEVLGSSNVYYQPPPTLIIKYPAIVYSRDAISGSHANNSLYLTKMAYEVVVIDKDPDSKLIGKIAQLPTCRFSRNYTVDNLNHDAFILYF